MFGLCVAPRVPFDAQFVQNGVLRPQEAHCQEDQVGGVDFFGTGYRFGKRPAVVSCGPLDLGGVQRPDIAVPVALKRRSRGQVDARVLAEPDFGLFLAIVQPVDFGPLRPGVVGLPLFRRPGHDFELREACAAVSHCGGHAVGAGVPPANDDDAPVFGRYVIAVTEIRVQQAAGVGGEEVHCKVDAFEIAPVNGQIPGTGRAGAEHDRIVVRHELFCGEVPADFRVRDEFDPFPGH